MSDNSSEPKSSQKSSSLLIWNIAIFVPAWLLIIGALNSDGGAGTFFRLMLLLTIAPTAIVLFGIDIYMLVKRFRNKQ